MKFILLREKPLAFSDGRFKNGTLVFNRDGIEVHSKAMSLKYPENIEKYSQIKRNEGMVCVSREIDRGFVQLRFVCECDRGSGFNIWRIVYVNR